MISTALFFFHNVLKILLTYRPDRSERKVQIGRPNGHFHLRAQLGDDERARPIEGETERRTKALGLTGEHLGIQGPRDAAET